MHLWGLAQRDSIPRIVTGKIDWVKVKKEMKAPVFQQNDLAIYVLRKDSLGELISKEENANWIKDFHFIDVNGDRYIDAFYSGATKAKGGYYTYFMRSDTGLQYPIKLQAPGYVHALKSDPKGLELILRDDAHGKGYLHTITEYYYHYFLDSLEIGWQLQMLGTTEVPIMGQGIPFVLKYAGQMRSTPKLLNEPPVDFESDGKYDMTGNVVATMHPGMKGLRFAETVADGRKWCFVILMETPKGAHVFKPMKGVKMAYAGWIMQESLEGK
jgi:hypothetical protein